MGSEVLDIKLVQPGKTDNRGLWYKDENGADQLSAPLLEYDELDVDTPEQRFLKICPLQYDLKDTAYHVRCELETVALADAPSFIAVKNARGYKFLRRPIEVNGQALLISCALEAFLRHLQTTITKPTVLWVRYICLREYHALEQKTFWTREWNDKMYNLADSVIDMSEQNAALLEKGLIEKVVDPDFQHWTKVWYGLPEQLMGPKTYPIRLGKVCSWEDPTCDYEYVPLDVIANEIRVMAIIPSTDTSAPVQVNVGNCPIKSEVTYSALSYRWGTDERTETIVLNGQKKVIRKSLADIIRALRHSSSSMILWIDAISINQDDVIERNRQIERMGAIYDTAVSVLSYIGPKTSDNELALSFIKELQQPMIRTNDDGEWHFGEWGSKEAYKGIWYGENRIKGEQLARMCAALYKFLTGPYFRRCWILQELAQASNPTLAIGGDFSTTWDQLETATYNLLTMFRADPNIAGMISEADPSLDPVQPEALAFPRKLAYFRYVSSRGARSMVGQQNKFKKNAPSFLETLILTREFECTESRDKIYSLWNLAQDKAGLAFDIDYTTPIRDVWVSFTRAWIEQHCSLDIIGAAEPLNNEELPSWCPHWPTPSTASCLIRHDQIPTRMMITLGDLDGALYKADGGADPSSYLHSQSIITADDVLRCTGIIVDRVSHVFAAQHPDCITEGMVFPRCDPFTFHQFHCWRADIINHLHVNKFTNYPDPDQAATAMFHGDTTAAWPASFDAAAAPISQQPMEKYACEVPRSRHIFPWVGGYIRTEAWDVAKMVLRGRLPFISEGGYMGLLPSYAAKMMGEEGEPRLDLAILAGCSVPVLLRERRDGTYQLCGTCFVQGWMDGEIVANRSDEEGSVGFWNGVHDAARLDIS